MELLKKLKNIRVSMFSNITETKLPEQFYLSDVLDSIKHPKMLKHRIEQIRKETDHDIQNALKVKLLPVVCFSGTFSERSDNKLIDFNPIICIDIDKVSDLNAERQGLMKLPYVLSIFTSPTATGLKVLVYHDLTVPACHKDLYANLGKDLGLTGRSDLIFDKSCSNVSRACFMSMDQNMWLNKNVEPYHFDPPTSPTTLKTDPLVTTKDLAFPATSLTNYNDIRKKIQDSHSLFESHYNMYPGCRNKNLFILASFFRYDGIPENLATDYLVAYYHDKNFPASEIKIVVSSAYK